MVKSLALLALILAAAPAAAEPSAATVRTADLDLSTPAGIARLDRRIERAIDLLCGTAFPTDLDAQAEIGRCRAETMKSVSSRRAMLVARAGGSPVIALQGR